MRRGEGEEGRGEEKGMKGERDGGSAEFTRIVTHHYSVSISVSVHMLNGPLYSFTVNQIAVYITSYALGRDGCDMTHYCIRT